VSPGALVGAPEALVTEFICLQIPLSAGKLAQSQSLARRALLGLGALGVGSLSGVACWWWGGLLVTEFN